MNLNLTFILLAISLAISCSNKAVIEKKYYTNGVLKNVIEYNKEGEVVKYSCYNLSGMLSFTLYYNNKIPLDNFTGVPWINLIWNARNYCRYDTINLEIELAKPPFIDVEFKIRNNKGEAKVINTGTSYIYNEVMTDSVENFTLIAVFSGQEKKYFTFKRGIPISCDSIQVN